MACFFHLFCLCVIMFATAFSVRIKRYPLSQVNVVEVYFVVDRKALELYTKEGVDGALAEKKAEEEIDYLITEMNLLYESLHPTVSVQIAKKTVFFTEQEIVQDSNILQGVYAHVYGALEDFDEFLTMKSRFNIPDYDAAVFLTGYDLFEDTTHVTGLSHVGTVCQSHFASSIVEFDGTFGTVLSMAQGIAQNLGSLQDSGSTGNVMDPSLHPDSTNRWYFSAQSADYISKTISGLSNNCLRQTSDSIIPDKDYAEGITDPDTVCRRRQGDQQSYMCRGRAFYNDQLPSGDHVCRRIFCAEVGQSACVSAFSSDGFACGIGKACREGICVSDPGNPKANQVTNEQCVFGDSPWVDFGFFSGTCPDFFARYSQQYCDYDAVSDSCCVTCASFKSKRYADDEHDNGEPLKEVKGQQTMAEFKNEKRLIRSFNFKNE